jgi:hypothetical protein
MSHVENVPGSCIKLLEFDGTHFTGDNELCGLMDTENTSRPIAPAANNINKTADFFKNIDLFYCISFNRTIPAVKSYMHRIIIVSGRQQ